MAREKQKKYRVRLSCTAEIEAVSQADAVAMVGSLLSYGSLKNAENIYVQVSREIIEPEPSPEDDPEKTNDRTEDEDKEGIF